MKTANKVLISAITIAFVLVMIGTTYAFHGGGVAHCDGCHSMHNSADNPVSGTINSTLLKGSDASSTCLNCHDHHGNAIGQDWRYHVRSDDGGIMSAGGDFYWVATDYTYVSRGQKTSLGINHGHNVIAVDFGMAVDSNPSNARAPGGTYPANILGCTSCHDAHGQVHGGTGHGHNPISVSGSYGAASPSDGSIRGNYRLLGDDLYTTGNHGAGEIQFINSAPIATADSYRGRSVAYGENMSEWCGNCHGAFLLASASAHKHPSGNDVKLNGSSVIAANYGSYIATGDFSGNNAYDALVPLELDEGDGSNLNATDPFNGGIYEASDGNVMCLTCHRAHASAHDNSTRWDMTVEYLVESPALFSNSLTVSQKAIVYYRDGVGVDIAAEYGTLQRSLCNKCHVQD